MAGRVIRPRPLRFEGSLAFVPLSQGMEAVIDAVDAPLVADRNWFAHRQDRNYYALAKGRVDGKSTLIMMHRVIFGPMTKPIIDHVDGDGLNNRRKNLREASYLENSRNSYGRRDHSKSGFKGVGWIKTTRKWRAQIREAGGRMRYLGYFVDPVEAAKAYDTAALVHFGEFARLNFPDEAEHG